MRYRFSSHRRGSTYVELLVSMILLSIAATAAVATWSMTVRIPATKRAAEVSLTLAVGEMERLKAIKYANLPETTAAAPNVSYFSSAGAPVTAAAARGYEVLSWVVTLDSNADGGMDARDLRELTVEVWNTGRTRRHERLQAQLAQGGL